MSDLFFYGTLRHLPLLELVLGHVPEVEPAQLPDHAVLWAQGQAFPMIVSKSGAQAEGVLLRGVSDVDRAALDYYEGGFAYELRPVTVETGAGPCWAEVFFPVTEDRWQPGAPWSLDDWLARWGRVTMRAAQEVMDRRGAYAAREVAGMLPFFRARAWAHEIAAKGAPQTLRRASGKKNADIFCGISLRPEI